MIEYNIKLNADVVKYLLEYLGKDIGYHRHKGRLDLAQRATDTYDLINEQKKEQDKNIQDKTEPDKKCQYVQTYKDKVFGWLIKQPIGSYDILKLTNEPDKFIQAVKDFIDLNDSAFEIEFSNDYKQVIKKK